VRRHDDPDDEMTNVPSLTRSDVRVTDMLLSGTCQPDELPRGLRPIAELLAALQAPPANRELPGWGDALTLYRETACAVAPDTLPMAQRRRHCSGSPTR
jgi:hypothetical protein